ncbi:hypothetical protein ACKUFS_10530 [Pseudomonas cannabina]|uniref:Uncharacterized protein n=1 Tax=Pseudomonas syringae pv. maculicola str. ES4326 TaxID=629265 RepID=A0A8T8C138_PSEYM|nr:MULTISPECIES: hypothetical protein [Pseudomonas syringae group]QHE97017.1 hypothetical protein PMA4326_010550 [Pseudomonas syringae pv. maculicola str. ES4326]QQN19938.1 hypothetical protein JGS08_14910 [Pseudomonas cannabina pv. alisalensis]UBY97673.1 hypothetical protein LCG56_00450 [Pseudomonas cannabina pv. alisalensis]
MSYTDPMGLEVVALPSWLYSSPDLLPKVGLGIDISFGAGASYLLYSSTLGNSEYPPGGCYYIKKHNGNKVGQDAGFVAAHDAHKGRGEGGVDIYRDKTTGENWLWNGVPGGDKEYPRHEPHLAKNEDLF